jgi:hypothetical protein
MATSGGIFKRCGCKDATTGRRLNKACPRLAERGHGTWYFHCSATNLLGRSERVRRGGYPSQAAARRARDEWPAQTGQERTARSWTVERWLRYWLSTRTSIRPTTKPHYTRDVKHFLIPYLGRLCLADLDTRRLRAAFAQIAKTTNHRGQPLSGCVNLNWIWIWPTFVDRGWSLRRERSSTVYGAAGGQLTRRTLLRRRSNFARPYMCLLIILSG